MKKRNIGIALLTVFLLLTGNIKDANAYFTTYVTAKGGYEISWFHQEEMHENVKDFHKYVTIESKEGSIPVYIRAKAFSGSTYTLTYSGENWVFNAEDGFYYYQLPLLEKETTSVLLIAIDQIPVNPKVIDQFNVVVVYESIPVSYDETGKWVKPELADWK